MAKQIDNEQKRYKDAIQKVKLQADYFLGFAKNSDSEQLTRLYDFLSGKITHFFLASTYEPKIFTWEDNDLYQEDFSSRRIRPPEAMKLITLYGRSDGSLTFMLNRYSDGSGYNMSIIPCRSYDEALKEAQALLDSLAISYVEKIPH